jgi:peptide/nickel transport system substrate-binding protein
LSDSRAQSELAHHLVDEVRAGRLTRGELIRRATVIGLSFSSIGALLAACGGSESDATSSAATSSSNGGAAATATASDATSVVTAAGTGQAGGTFRIAIAEMTGALDPVTMYDAGTIAVAQQIAEYLIWVDPGGKLRPVLAEKWSADATAKTWTFSIRPNVVFNDGTPLTAADVVASIKRLADPKSESAALSSFSGLLSPDNIEARDDHTVVFHLDAPFADFPYFVSSANYNTLIVPKGYAGNLQKVPVGTGPFTLSALAPKQSATFVKNPKYWAQGLPHLDGVKVGFFGDTQAQILALQGGEYDAMLLTAPQLAAPLTAGGKFDLLQTPAAGWYELHMRTDQDPWKDKRVRQAVAYAIDRPALLQTLYQGKGELAADHVFAPSMAIHPDVPGRQQDLAKAKALLAAAGKGNGFSVTLTTENSEIVPNLAVLFKNDLKKIGIDVTIKVISQAAYYGSGSNQPWLEVNFGLVDWANRYVPSQFFLPAFTSKGIWNSAHWKNPQFDALAKKYNATLDTAGRTTIATQMATIMQDEVPAVNAFWTSQTRAASKKVGGFIADPSSYLDLTKTTLAS